MKERVTSWDVKVLVQELQMLRGSYLGKVYQIASDELVLCIGKKELFVKMGKYLCWVDKKFEKPRKPSSFAMLLRKYLGNKKLKEAVQPNFDRIIELIFRNTYTLTIELFGDGNMILRKGAKIIQPFYHRKWRARKLIPAAEYQYPPSKPNPLRLLKEKFVQVLKNSKKDLVRTLALELNLSGLYAEEICKRIGLEKTTPAREMNPNECGGVYVTMKKLIKALERPSPTIIRSKSKILDVIPIELELYKGYEKEAFKSFNQALCMHVLAEKARAREERRRERGLELMERKKRKIAQQKLAIARFKKEEAESRKKAELIYKHYPEIEMALEEGKGRWVRVQVEGVGLVLDRGGSISENAERYYARAKKGKEKRKGAEKALKESLEGVVRKKRVPKAKPQKERKFWFERYRWFLSSAGELVLAGKDARSNERVVKKHMRDNDFFAHADIKGGSCVLLRGNDTVSKREAAEFALIHSKLYSRGFASGDAYCVGAEQVAKTPPSGEFLPRGSFMIRGERKWYRRVEIKAAVGEIEYKEIKKLMCGPVNAVKKRAERYVILKPGFMPKHKLAKKLSKCFGVSVDEVMSILPPGDAEILESKGVSL